MNGHDRPMSFKGRSLHKRFSPIFLSAWVAIPLGSADWKNEKYSKIPGNVVTFEKPSDGSSSSTIKIAVDRSASPLFHLLDGTKQVKGVRVRGKIQGKLNLSETKRQGAKGADDFGLRFGLVVPGSKTLSGLKTLFAAEWVKRLFALAPKTSGLDRVEFFNVVQDSRLKGQTRQHPSSDLLFERFPTLVGDGGEFVVNESLANPIPALALWLGADGDDTNSKFSVEIKGIELDVD